MDPSSSSSTQQHNQDQYSPDRLQIQERDWLSCSTSTKVTTTTTNQGISIEGDNHDKVVVVVEREHMFDKVVTPSDVGKLNRLVIPKQHAEKYFPLDTTNNNSNNNSSCGNNENKAGLLLNFEDRTGKSWRFRYSYWNSSQSYVMTKGWSRFVKEKQLSAGDIVSFQRAVGDDNHSKSTFFIDWRCRPSDHHLHHHHLGTAFSVHHYIPTWRSGGGGSSTTPTFFLRSHPHPNSLWDHSINNNNNGHNNINSHLSPINGKFMNMVHSGPLSGSGSESGSGSLILLRSPVPNSGLINHHPYLMPYNPHHISSSPWTSNNDNLQGSARRDEPPKVFDSVPVLHGVPPSPSGGGGGVGKPSLRLFGVNMEYDQLTSGSMGITTTLSMLSNQSTSNLDDTQNSSPSNHSFRHG